jgi:hypothetical protein
MKPTITNAFTVGPSNGAKSAAGKPARNRMRGRQPDTGSGTGNDAVGFGSLLAPMQVDLRESDFGFSLELNPIQAVDAVHALLQTCPRHAQFLVSMEQSAWRDGNAEAALSVIADRFGITALEIVAPEQLVLDATGLFSLAAVLQLTRLLVVAIDGPIEVGDARAINRAIEAGSSPLTADVRACAALEIIGDRSVVLHAALRATGLHMISQNFRHYLAAILDRPAESFAAPDIVQMEQLLSISGALTVRPIETTLQGDSVDVGVNTSLQRFSQPANLSLVFDMPSNSWHTE